ncbi:MAG: hypothetical protein KDC12_02865 [Flavobacteriales bacterium]|nr:hypothetical protein [Flavobacteriales bacterium]
MSKWAQLVLGGVQLATQKMIETKIRNGGEIVIMENGIIKVIPASKIAGME